MYVLLIVTIGNRNLYFSVQEDEVGDLMDTIQKWHDSSEDPDESDISDCIVKDGVNATLMDVYKMRLE